MLSQIFRLQSSPWALAVLLVAPIAPAAWAQPDLSGTYDVGTLTPLERAEAYGDQLYLSEEEAADMEKSMAARTASANAASDPERAAPKVGGNIGGYNFFWIDLGETATSVDGRFRTSIISQPANGRIPPMTEAGAARMKNFLDDWKIIWRTPDPTTGKNDGTAWWLDLPGAAPYDDLEQRPLAERCIIGSRSTAGPPMLPNIYNNHKRVIQTDTHFVVLTEMNHDARVVRLIQGPPDGERPALEMDESMRRWLGESIGWWDGDTLVVQTMNLRDTPSLSGADENLIVTEQFSRGPNGSLLYRFRVEDETVWTEPWAGEYSWAASDGKVYEYACHEGNYALGNVMRGARALEREAAKADGQ